MLDKDCCAFDKVFIIAAPKWSLLLPQTDLVKARQLLQLMLDEDFIMFDKILFHFDIFSA